MDPRIHRRVEPQKSTGDTVVEWLNEAATTNDDNLKVQNLYKVQEIILNKEPLLLDNCLDEILQFAVDRNSDVRKAIAGFIEDAGEKAPETIPRLILVLIRLVTDTAAVVAKRALRASGRIFKATLKWVSFAPVFTPDMENAWGQISNLKIQIINMIDSVNDGIRTQAIKFLEGVILIQSYPQENSLKKDDDFSLEDVPLTLTTIRRRNLEAEAKHVIALLINFFHSVHVSSVNLITCMGSLSLIAKMRPQFMSEIIQAMQKLLSNLPPTLTDSQVTSVQKQMKLTLLGFLKHPACSDYQNVGKLLLQLGCKENEIAKFMPKPEELRKIKKRQQESIAAQTIKKARIEIPVIEEPEIVPLPVPAPQLPELIELSEGYIADRLSVEIATELVMSSMPWVPDSVTVPPTFMREYQPTSTTDITVQRRVVAKLLANQIKLTKAKKSKPDTKDERLETVMEDLIKNPSISVAEVRKERKREKDREKELQAKAALEAHEKSLAKARSRVKALKLSEVTKPLTNNIRDKMLLMAVDRILGTEKSVIIGGVSNIRLKILTTLAATFNPYVKELILRHITEDMRTRLELAMCWLYEEYALLQGFQRRTILHQKPLEGPHQAYNSLFCTLVTAIDNITGKDRDILLARLYLEAPLITEDAVESLKMISCDESRGLGPLHLLKDLVIRRPIKQLIFLNVIECHTGHESSMIRDCAIQLVVQLYARPELSKLIEEYAVLYLGFLRVPNPPEIVFGSDRGRPNIEEHWTESTTRACLGLYLALLTENHKLIHELARVYTSMSAEVKRIVLRLVEGPVRAIGMASVELLELVENCPKGAETLITRIIHILTDKAPPSPELVAKVRELYQTRVSDVRFLIPVLNGLTKKEVIAALPKLIKLNPIVVKEVFNKLLGTHNIEGGATHTSPITPAELMIALHTIEPNKAELKTVIKATSLCFAEKQIFTQDIVAVVMQQLMDMTPLPTLLMRTVIQSLSLYPRLSGFVMNILQRLILKQVWKQPKVWEGFVKCCERTEPQSFSVILQLPPAQLVEALKMAPNLRQPLIDHVEAFADNQKAHIPQSIMDVIKGKPPILMHDEFDIAPPGDFHERQDTNDLDNLEPAPPGLD
ncbi:symplekin [Phymastichus coffea]|uniref:symplekin n=1 Tax=Phymastichus coffea TaxID=108790 RepID=UPI00273C96E3|nr:symplekin [Phymastichus coffea]